MYKVQDSSYYFKSIKYTSILGLLYLRLIDFWVKLGRASQCTLKNKNYQYCIPEFFTLKRRNAPTIQHNKSNCCLQIGHDYGYFTMVTDLPKYMTGVLKFDIHRTGTLAALPYAVMWLSSIAFGWLCDKIVKRNWLTVTNARKTFTTIGTYTNADANWTQ